jgi:rubrerythrin
MTKTLRTAHAAAHAVVIRKLGAEAEQAKLYAEARDSLGNWKTVRDFCLCAVCGYTTTNLNFEKCASCFNSKDRYVNVS